MKLCVSSGISATLPDRTPLPFEESVKLAAQAGFEEFDLGLSTRLLLQEDWEKRLHEMQEMIDRAGMQIRYVHTPYDYPRSREAEDWERFELASMRCIEKVPELGADCAAIHPRSFMKPEYDPDEEYQEAVRFLTPYCEAAHRYGVVLGIEIMRGAGASAPAKIRRFGTDTEVLIRLADELDEGICWDTGHANISLQQQYKSILKIGKRLKMVHINDNFAEDDVHLAPFLGKIDWTQTMKGLREIGYCGSMNLEVKCNALPPELRESYAAYMAASGRYLIRLFESI